MCVQKYDNRFDLLYLCSLCRKITTSVLNRDKGMEKTVYVYELPTTLRRQLSVLLDNPVESAWKLLAERIGLSYDEIAHMELALQRPGGSPTLDLLTRWGVQNATKGDLIAYLEELGLVRAADLIRNG